MDSWALLEATLGCAAQQEQYGNQSGAWFLFREALQIEWRLTHSVWDFPRPPQRIR